MDDLNSNDYKIIKQLKERTFTSDDPLTAKLDAMKPSGKKASLDKFISINQHQLVQFLKQELNV